MLLDSKQCPALDCGWICRIHGNTFEELVQTRHHSSLCWWDGQFPEWAPLLQCTRGQNSEKQTGCTQCNRSHCVLWPKHSLLINLLENLSGRRSRGARTGAFMQHCWWQFGSEVTQVTISVGTGNKMLSDTMRNYAGLRNPTTVVGVEQSVVVSGCL